MISIRNAIRSIAIISLFSFLNVNIYVSAKPAKPGVIDIVQPDGSKFKGTLQGNFHNRAAYSEDGYFLLPDDEGFYTFAEIDNTGKVQASAFRAVAPQERSVRLNNFLSGINKESVIEAALKEITKNNESISTRGKGLYTTQFPSKGSHHSLAVLVEYADVEFTLENPREYFYRMLNEPDFSDYGSTGSARDYFISNSNGLFEPEFDVYGPVKLANNMNYYGGRNDARAYQMAVEACELLDDEIDFTYYDANEDGFIDNIYIFYAGYGEADGGSVNSVWPHSWDISIADTNNTYLFDGVILNHYACSNELQAADDSADGIGTFTHEFSHVMGLPDLYCTNYANAFTPGTWSILDGGSYNNHSRTPPNYSSFERYALDWIDPEIIREEGYYTLENLHDSNKAFLFKTENRNEYYLLENRQQTGNDSFLPHHGMLVWHIDFKQQIWDNNIVNNDPSHQYVDLIEADNKRSRGSITGDPFPGSDNIREFTCLTKPSFTSWNKEPVAYDLFEITESEDGLISFMAISCVAGVHSIQDQLNDLEIRNENGLLSSSQDGIMLYDLTGRLISHLSKDPIKLSKGIYIAIKGNQKKKLLVK